MNPKLKELEKGRCLAEIKETRAIRNHLRCIHAIALSNLAELSSGLAFMATLPAEYKAIVTGFKIEYFKKARGRICAQGKCAPIAWMDEGSHKSQAVLRDEAGEEVARFEADWQYRKRSL